MEIKQIKSPEDFQMAMGAVQSSIELLGMFDWDHWLQLEAMFQTAGPQLDAELFQAMRRDPQWEQKRAVFQAAANYMKAIEDVRAQLRNNNEG